MCRMGSGRCPMPGGAACHMQDVLRRIAVLDDIAKSSRSDERLPVRWVVDVTQLCAMIAGRRNTDHDSDLEGSVTDSAMEGSDRKPDDPS